MYDTRMYNSTIMLVFQADKVLRQPLRDNDVYCN